MAEYRVFCLGKGRSELEGRSAIKTQNPTGYVSRVRCEALVIADGAPDPPQEYLKSAVLKARAILAIHQAQPTLGLYRSMLQH